MSHADLKIMSKNIKDYEEQSLNTCNWEIKISHFGGRGVFATKPIEKGSFIFANKPLIMGPRPDAANGNFCTVCYDTIDEYNPCKKCNILMCSQKCADTEQHKRECDFVVNNWEKKSDRADSKAVTRTVIYLRALLLEKRELHMLLNLQKSSPSATQSTEIVFLESNYMIPKEQVLFMHTVESILKINSFRISNNAKDKKIPKRGLYPLSSFLNHSCVPNTRNIFTSDNVMCVYASRDIEVGEEILTCYTGLLWCTQARRCQLFKTKGFWCKCSRCSDATEMGTKLSALKCLKKECVGGILPVLPLNPKSDWVCDVCCSLVPADRVSTVQSVLGSLVGSLDLDSQFQLDTSILERLAIVVPLSNHIFIDIHLRLGMAIGAADGIKICGITFVFVFVHAFTVVRLLNYRYQCCSG